MYDFDAIIDRRGTHSLKWDGGEEELPMWVADMDFRTAPAVTDALLARAQHGIFGYTTVPDSWYDAYIDWWKRRHGVAFERDWMQFATGVVPAISSIVKRVTNVGDNVALITPVYDIFFHSVENAGRHVLECPLSYDGERYALDFGALEACLADPLTTLLLFCNPHNPVGKIWTKAELEQIGALCARYGVCVLSDEIHCDLTAPHAAYVPYASVSEECLLQSITCVSASKAFNLAGLQSAAVVVADPALRNRVVRGLNSDEVAEPNCFAAIAAIAALTKGEAWLDELREYLFENRRIAEAFLKAHLPMLRALRADASYLLWVDCRAVAADTAPLSDCLWRETGLRVTAGGQYRGNGAGFLRINLACPKQRLRDGLSRLERGVLAYSAARRRQSE